MQQLLWSVGRAGSLEPKAPQHKASAAPSIFAMLRSVSVRTPGVARLSQLGRPFSVSADSLLASLHQHHREAAEREVKWFTEQMPATYFRQVAPSTQERHLRAITALASERIATPEVKLVDDTVDGLGRELTYIAEGQVDGGLKMLKRQLLDDVKAGSELRRVNLFSSKDGRICLNLFETASAEEARFGASTDKVTQESEAKAADEISSYRASLKAGDFVSASPGQHAPPSRAILSKDEMDAFLSRASSRYVTGNVPRLLFRQFGLYERVAGGDASAVELERDFEGEAGNHLMMVALPGVPPRQALWRTLNVLQLHNVHVLRAQVDAVHGPKPGAEPVTLLRTLITGRGTDGDTSSTAISSGVDWKQVAADTERIKWLDDSALRLATKARGKLSLVQAEVAGALASLSLSIVNHPLLAPSTIHERLWSDSVLPHTLRLSSLFLQRFDPVAPMSNTPFAAALQAARDAIHHEVGDIESQALLNTMADGIEHTIRTNVHLDGRWALALRLAPQFFDSVKPVNDIVDNTPFGVFYVAGRHFQAFHTRFADIARGGLRIVWPPNEEAHAQEFRKQFMECFNLAWAQQLKNKDIPEGGSKAVCLVRPVDYVSAEQRSALMHACVKRATNSMLDLLVDCDNKSGKYGTIVTPAAIDEAAGNAYVAPDKELIFLGPDENVTPADIEWIVENAAIRKYAMPSAFMSSKPKAGINHKVYGVTSEGVAVFLKEALLAIGIDPHTMPFSVKLTGGPDGDVAGNMIKILHRDYPKTVRVVGMADGTGCAEDPNGLPLTELLRLFERGDPLGKIDKSQLSGTGVLTLADTPAGAALRNGMHNRVIADAFVPAGGRPATMHAGNWQQYLLEDGTPSSKCIVEGANLFLTAEARQALFDTCQLPIVKDSSANKCGVICSSMEIVASMSLSDDEFLEMKDLYVSQVIDRLRELARLEAQLIFSEQMADPSASVPSLCERVSYATLRASNALNGLLNQMEENQRRRLWPLVREQLPQCLFDQHASRLPKSLPWEYQSAMISSGLASRLVYREGLAFSEALSDAQLPGFALRYLQQEQVVRTLAKQVRDSGADYAPQVESLLLRGGVRAAAQHAGMMAQNNGYNH